MGRLAYVVLAAASVMLLAAAPVPIGRFRFSAYDRNGKRIGTSRAAGPIG